MVFTKTCKTTVFFVHVHTCLDLVHRIHIPGTYMECTSSRLYVQSKKQKAKKLPLHGFEPKTSSTESRCLNCYASSVVVIWNIVTVYVYCCTCRTSGAGPAAPPALAMTSPARTFWVTWTPRARTRKSCPGQWPGLGRHCGTSTHWQAVL